MGKASHSNREVIVGIPAIYEHASLLFIHRAYLKQTSPLVHSAICDLQPALRIIAQWKTVSNIVMQY